MSGPTSTIGALTVTVPSPLSVDPDWSTTHFACLSTPASTCALQIVDLHQPGHFAPFDNSTYPWYTQKDTPKCYGVRDRAARAAIVTSDRVQSVPTSEVVGGKQAEYGEWTLTCADGFPDQHIKAWWFPDDRIYVIETHADPSTDGPIAQVLGSARFAS